VASELRGNLPLETVDCGVGWFKPTGGSSLAVGGCLSSKLVVQWLSAGVITVKLSLRL
jgi:hypothetical protein